MNSSDYIYILNKPDAVNERHGSFLDKIIEEFPYFQSARALRLKKLYNQNSFTYNQQLKKTAAFTTDRGVLFELITSEDFIAVQKDFFNPKEKQPDDINLIENTVNPPYQSNIVNDTTIEAIIDPEFNKDQKTPETVNAEPDNTIVTTVNSNNIVSTNNENSDAPEADVKEVIQHNAPETEKVPQPIAFLNELTAPKEYEDLFVAKAHTIEEQTFVENTPKESTTDEQVVPEQTPLLINDSSLDMNIYDIVFVPKTDTEEAKIIKQEAVNAFESSSFIPEKTAVDRQNEIDKKDNEVVITEKLQIGKPLHFSKEEKHSFQEWLQLSTVTLIDRSIEKQEQDKEAVLEKQKKLALIDKFIESNPKIPPVKNNNIVPNINEEQQDDHSMLMTETLAKVYLEQKKYQKAIQAYEILILKYPEKITFFADRISDIKTLQQNNT